MGKKSDAAKKGDMKTLGTRKKKSAVPEMTWKEALLAYDINIKEKALEDVKYELKVMEMNNFQLKTLNFKLEQEQQEVIKRLLKMNQELDKSILEKGVFTKDDVTAKMKSNWEKKKDQERMIVELHETLARKDVEIEALNHEVARWQDYRDNGEHEHCKTVQLLEQEMADIEKSFTDISAHLEQRFSQMKEDIETSTTHTIDEQKITATEKAIAKMDKFSRREVMDNDWLRRETEKHRKLTADLFTVVEKLEDENLQFLSELFECQVEDLHISRSFFMTEYADTKNTLLSTDLCSSQADQLLPLEGSGTHEDGGEDHLVERVREVRPKSAIQQAVEDKMLQLSKMQSKSRHREEPEDSEQYVDEIVHYGGEDSETGDPFLEFHHFDDDDFDDYLKLGPLELKLLNITGHRMPIHRPETPPDDVIKALELRPENWPVTREMLRQTLRGWPRDVTNTATNSGKEIVDTAT